jgi:hypothetical protein
MSYWDYHVKIYLNDVNYNLIYMYIFTDFGYASLTEHRVENCVVLAFLILGLVSAIGGFRKVNGCRCAGVACILFMLAAG